MKTLNFFAAALLSATFFFTTAFTAPDVTCPFPQNVTKVAETSSSISFDWDDCGCTAPTYEVYFVKDGNTSTTYKTSSSDFTFTNLAVGEYEFYFQTNCGGGTISGIIVIDDLITG